LCFLSCYSLLIYHECACADSDDLSTVNSNNKEFTFWICHIRFCYIHIVIMMVHSVYVFSVPL
jgi:hypothetical protein